MSYLYNAYGYTIHSEKELLLHRATSNHIDFTIEFKQENQTTDDIEHIEVKKLSSHMEFSFPKYGSANIYRTHIEAFESPSLSIFERTEFIAQNIILMLHVLKGSIVIHAASVIIGDKAYCIAGAHASGKSTLTAALLLNGYGVLADEFSILTVSKKDNRIIAQPGKGWISINKDVVSVFKGNHEFIGESSGKFCVRTPSCQAVECKAIVFLNILGVESPTHGDDLDLFSSLFQHLKIPGHQGALAPGLFLENLCYITKNLKMLNFRRQKSLNYLNDDVSNFLTDIAALNKDSLLGYME
ncbi:MAG: hypothetical protein GYA55_13015 [SAR324 cluster bacterium]|uniref:HPr kinase/phosphorylase C-terminal domain-containing protein n=1 Tax=SAR324 cluster bacterium TaxID=2024889 RepID=A0A7X9ILB8_9DELT|nr:hypothetical protein [SAR324 cluster bacterium]